MEPHACRKKRLPFLKWLTKKLISFWDDLRELCYHYGTLIETGFIILYAFEQYLLINYTRNAHSVEEISYVISVFVIIVLTTFTIEKVVLFSRFKFLKAAMNGLFCQHLEAQHHIQRIYDWAGINSDGNSESLNKIKT